MSPKRTAAALAAFLLTQAGCINVTFLADPPRPDDDDDATGAQDLPSGPAGYVPEPLSSPGAAIDPNDAPGDVLLHSGELKLERTDLRFAGHHLGLRVARTWRSFRSELPGPLGFGWDSPLFARLTPDGDDLLLNDGTGREVRFAADGDAFTSPVGLFDVLRRDGDGHALRHPGGTVLRFDAQGRLARIEDRRGSMIDFEHDGDRLQAVIDELGRRIELSWNEAGQVSSISDFDGRSVVYSYEDGFLVQARSPVTAALPEGARERYVYDRDSEDVELASNLVAVIGPNEVQDGSLTPWLQSTYGDAGDDFDRVLAQTVGGTNHSGVPAGGDVAYAYDFDAADSASVTVATDRNGNVTRYAFDDLGHTLQRLEDPDGGAWSTDLAYDDDGLLLRLDLPGGNATEWTFDADNPSRLRRADVLAVVQLPDPSRHADQPELRTTYEREPLFGGLLSETSPLGNDPSHVGHDGQPGTPERYTSTVTYDWQEADAAPAWAAWWGLEVPSELLDRGDVNGDGRTDQAFGNPVRSAAPAVRLLPGSLVAEATGSSTQLIASTMTYDDFGDLVAQVGPAGSVDRFEYHPTRWLAARITDADGLALTSTFAYDPRGNLTARTNPRGYTWLRSYDERDQPIASESPKVDPSMDHGYRTETVFDAAGRATTQRIENWSADEATGAPVLVSDHPWIEHVTTHDLLGQVVELSLDATRDADIPPMGDPETLTHQFRFDANGNRVEVRSPLAVLGVEPDAVDTWSFDARDHPDAVTIGGGSEAASSRYFDHDANGNQVGVTDGNGNLESVVLDGYDRDIAQIGRDGTEIQRLRDALGQIIREEIIGKASSFSSPSVLASASFGFDEVGRNVSASRSIFVPEAADLVSDAWVGDVGADGEVTSFSEYDADGNLLFVIDDFGATWSYDYDGAGRRFRTTNPLGAVAEIALDAAGNPEVVREIRVRTDGLSSAGDVRSVFVHDPLSRVVRMSDGDGNTFFRAYDSRNHKVATWDARGPVVADPMGLVAAPINERGNPIFHDLDGIGRPWQTRRPLTVSGDAMTPVDAGHPFTPEGVIRTISVFDPNNRVVAQIDGMGGETHTMFDPVGRAVAQVYPDGGMRSFEHDANGNVVVEVDENGTVHSYGYDDVDRMTSHSAVADGSRESAPGLPMIVGTTEQTFGYDGLGRMTSITDNNDPTDASDDSLVRQRWSSLGQRLEEVQDGDVVASSFLGARLAEIHYPGTDRVVFHERNALGKLVGLANPTHIQVTFDWEFTSYECCDCCGDCDGDGGEDDDGGGGDGGGDGGGGCGDGGGGDGSGGGTGLSVQILDADTGAWIPTLTVTRELDSNLLVESQSVFTPICNIFETDLERNRNSDVVLVSSNYNSPWSWIDRSVELDLDSVGRPTARNVVQDELSLSEWGFRDEPADSFTGMMFGADQTIRVVDSVTAAATAPSTDIRDFDPAKQRVGDGYQYNGVSADGARDGAAGTGLRTADGDFLYQWDAWNRLRVVRLASDPDTVVASFDYDGHPAVAGGRRIRKSTADGVVRYLWKDDDVIEEREDGVVARQFIHGSGKDEVVAMDVDEDGDGEPETMYVPVRDHLGNTTHLVAADGAPVEVVTYSGFGVPTVRSADGFEVLPSSGVGFPYLFAGRRFDAEIGKYYQRARMYDPAVGEFLSRDPIGFWGDFGNLGNPMAYAGNRPDNYTDPSGLNSIGQYVGWFWEAWKEEITDPMAERACKAMEEDGGNTTTGYTWAVGEVIGTTYLLEAYADITIEGNELSGGERVLRGGFGLASTVLTVTGTGSALRPRGAAAAPGTTLYHYSAQTARGTQLVGGGGRLWATARPPGPWLYRNAWGSGVSRFLTTGRWCPYTPGGGTIFQFSSRAASNFGPIRHGFLWKSLGGQYCTRPGVIGLGGFMRLGGDRVLVTGSLNTTLRGSSLLIPRLGQAAGQGVLNMGLGKPAATRVGNLLFNGNK